MRYISLLLLLSACAPAKDPIVVDPQLSPYINQLSVELNVDVSDISAKFSDLDPGIVGECVQNDQWKIIYITTKFWQHSSDIERQMVVAHELGHCTKNLTHNASILPNGCPASIMHPSTISIRCIQTEGWKYYSDNLIKALHQ